MSPVDSQAAIVSAMCPGMEQRPLVPSDVDQQVRAQAFTRAAFALCMHAADPGGLEPEDIARSRWETQPRVARIVRGIVDPLDTSGSAAIVTQAFSSFLGGLGQPTAAAALMSSGISLGPIPAGNKCYVPWVAAGQAPELVFLDEGDPVPIADLTSSTLAVEPRFASIAMAASRQLFKAGNAEEIFGFMLRLGAARGLDREIFATTAATTSKPGGLLCRLIALANTTGSMSGDLATLTAAIIAAGGGQNVIFVTSPGRARAMQIASNTPLPVVGSLALTDDQLVGVDGSAFFYSISQPTIRTSTEALVAMSDDPEPVVSDAGVLASSPVRSLFQTDAIALAIEMRIDWVVPPGLVQMISSPQW